MQAIGAGRIVSGGHNSPAPAMLWVGTNGDWLAGEMGIAALLDGGEEGVHIDMGNYGCSHFVQYSLRIARKFSFDGNGVK